MAKGMAMGREEALEALIQSTTPAMFGAELILLNRP